VLAVSREQCVFHVDACGRPQGGRDVSGSCGRICGQGEGVKNLGFVDILNGWPQYIKHH